MQQLGFADLRWGRVTFGIFAPGCHQSQSSIEPVRRLREPRFNDIIQTLS